ncbi:MAG: sulfurtransferase [Gammaproteobacteria bacterium]|nr:MAG: sulfurtransferase [Gammaproteobacteria bacterium]
MPSSTLIDTGTLVAHLGDPAWIVFDCRFDLTQADAGRRAYLAGHIPGARYAHLEEDLSSPITPESGRHPLPDPDIFARKLGQWGVDGRTQVVVYDEGGGAIAARLWWLLRWLGHSATALLDGGLAKWQREQRPLGTDVPTPVTADFSARRDDSLWVSTSYVQRAIEGGEYLLIDARAAKRFRGEIEPLDKVAGHIPGSVNRPFHDNLDATGCFQAPASLREQFLAQLKERSPAQVISTCGSGVTACHNVLAMEHAGLAGARLYAGSWSEWIADDKRPVATGEA